MSRDTEFAEEYQVNNHAMRSSWTSSPMKDKATRRESIDLRKLPADILLHRTRDEGSASTNVSSIGDETERLNQTQSDRKLSLLKRLFFNPKYTLHSQMLISFGMVNIWTLLVVVTICSIATARAGQKIKVSQIVTFRGLSQSSLGITARYMAESLDQRLRPVDVVDILHEACQDRFLGGIQDSDQHVPFQDLISGQNRYPIVGPDLFLDWQVPQFVTEQNFQEHVHHKRWPFYQAKANLSTESAVFMFQGACDPNAAVNTQFYLDGCVEANNNISTGGIYNPSNLTSIIYRKSKDLVPVMKSLFETNVHVRELGIYFKASGSGAVVNFPAYALDNTSYVSNGCDWMKERNPFNPTQTIGTSDEIAKCHGKGMVVSSRLYNPMERLWCSEQALNPSHTLTRFDLDAWSSSGLHLFLGRALYDRHTKEFLACTYVAVSLDPLASYLMENRITENSHVSIVTFDSEGTVLVTSVDTRQTGSDKGFYRIAELNLGITNDSYREFLTLIDFSKEWHPSTTLAAYDEHFTTAHGYTVYAYPIPPVPSDYDPAYKPDFLVMVSISDEDLFRSVEEVNASVNQTVREVIFFAVSLGAVGLFVTALVIKSMAKTLTAPLEDMNRITQGIIDSFGAQRTDENPGDRSQRHVSSSPRFCSPKTEVYEVVSEFNKMVSTFSGSLLAKTQKAKTVEVENPFRRREPLQEIYQSRNDESFCWNMGSHDLLRKSNSASSLLQNNELCGVMETISHIHSERIIVVGSSSSSFATEEKVHHGKFSSRLFWWIVLLLVMPLLLFTLSISAWVTIRIHREFNNNVDVTEEYYTKIVVEALQLHATLRAQAVLASISSPVRDLQILSRFFGWLLFGGLATRDSFTNLHSGANECKNYEQYREECSYFTQVAFCHCSWNDRYGASCTDSVTEDPRYRQIPYFLVQSSDALPNGNRTQSSFPLVDFSPRSTSWWDDPLVVPGHNVSPPVSTRHETLYDRLRFSSAMPLFPVLYNIDTKKVFYYAQHIAFEADGLMLGYEVCPGLSYGHMWSSSYSNQASEFRPELCPIGKYGYDPRCREWYHTGRTLATKGISSLYITAPYQFASNTDVNAQSATNALIDPTTGKHVAQILVDFQSTSSFMVLDKKQTKLSPSGFPILITVMGDRQNNTVIGPGFSLNEAAKEISSVVLPFDHDCLTERCSKNIEAFRSIEELMRKGDIGVAKFERTTSIGQSESVFMAYAPVSVRKIKPKDPSMFSRGADAGDYQVYSLGLCETEEALLEPFAYIVRAVDNQVKAAITMIAVVIAFAAIIILYISYLMTVSVTDSMLYLLDLIRRIKNLKPDRQANPPPLEEGKVCCSYEVISISIAMQTLYTVVQAANNLFYSADIEIAYHVLADALRLFKRLGNEKAIGVASNNLGNLMLILFQKMMNDKDQPETICGLTRNDIITKGTGYFYDAIRLGEKAYEEFFEKEGWSAACLDFMQHLSNRYFNRALFLLAVKRHHKEPQEIADIALRDLQISRDMDLEVLSYGEDVGLNRENRSDKLYAIGLIRIRSHNMIMKLGYPDEGMSQKGYPEDWDITEKFVSLFDLITTESRRGESKLFEDVTYFGRMQEVEGELIRYVLHKDRDVKTAARIGIRMLMEDAYILPDCGSIAVDAIRQYVDEMNLIVDEKGELRRELQDCKSEIYRSVLDHIENEREALSARIDQTDCDDLPVLTRKISTARLSKQASSLSYSVLWITENSSGGFVTMEDF